MGTSCLSCLIFCTTSSVMHGLALHMPRSGRMRDIPSRDSGVVTERSQWTCASLQLLGGQFFRGAGQTEPQLPTIVTSWTTDLALDFLHSVLFFSFPIPFPGFSSPNTLSAHKLFSIYTILSQALFSGTILANVVSKINAIRLY